MPFQPSKVALKRLAKSVLRPLIYRYPPVGLQPERLQVWLRTLTETAALDGAILEVGCSLGGTAALSWKMLGNLGFSKRYVCIDTFGGFVPEHFEDDVRRGNAEVNRWMFADNSIGITRGVLNQLGAHGVELIQADITMIPEKELPEKIAAALLDVDLALPIYEGLKKLYPRLVERGIILIDDCPEVDHCDWQARQGYESFCREFGVEPRYEFGLGVLTRLP